MLNPDPTELRRTADCAAHEEDATALREAADEIERLRGEVARLTAELADLNEQLGAEFMRGFMEAERAGDMIPIAESERRASHAYETGKLAGRAMAVGAAVRRAELAEAEVARLQSERDAAIALAKDQIKATSDNVVELGRKAMMQMTNRFMETIAEPLIVERDAALVELSRVRAEVTAAKAWAFEYAAIKLPEHFPKTWLMDQADAARAELERHGS